MVIVIVILIVIVIVIVMVIVIVIVIVIVKLGYSSLQHRVCHSLGCSVLQEAWSLSWKAPSRSNTPQVGFVELKTLSELRREGLCQVCACLMWGYIIIVVAVGAMLRSTLC